MNESMKFIIAALIMLVGIALLPIVGFILVPILIAVAGYFIYQMIKDLWK